MSREMLVQARRRGDRQAEAMALVGQIAALVMLGSWQEALAVFSEAEPLAEKAAFTQVQLLEIVPVYCEQGAPEKAEALIRKLEAFRETENPEARTGFAVSDAMVRRARGDYREALAAAERGLAFRDELGIVHRLVKQSFVEALQAAVALGDLDQARSLLAGIEALHPGELTPYLAAQAARFRARIRAATIDDDQVAKFFGASTGLFRDGGFAPSLAVTLTEHAEWLSARGLGEEARPLVDEAEAIFTPLEAKPWLERVAVLGGSRPRHAASAMPTVMTEERGGL